MRIKEIKSQLRIGTVLKHYGMTADRNGMLCCPFHEDRKKSMRVYAETDTVYCFAGGCEVAHADVIDLVMHLEKCSKHEAIKKCKSLLGLVPPLLKTKTCKNTSVMQSSYEKYLGLMKSHREAQHYCEGRGLNWSALGIGYKSRKTREKWGRGCIIFGLKDERGAVVSLYGRSIVGEGHYYQSGRSGLYPGYPAIKSRVLILCESVIDSASLEQLSLPLASYSILSLYGTNGMSEEHLDAIGRLSDLEEIIFALDGDEAGDKSTGEYVSLFSGLLPSVRLSRLVLPAGEDINSLYVGHADREGLFADLLEKRLVLKEVLSPKVGPVPSRTLYQLNSENPHNLIYPTRLGIYYIKGGIRYSVKDLDSLKVSLVVENAKGLKSRNKLDLYEDRQVEKVSRIISEKLGLRADLVELDIQSLTDALEIHRSALSANDQLTKAKIEVPMKERERCLSFLRKVDLLSSIDKYLESYGVIGEVNNRRLGFCIVSSYGMPSPLHGLIQGSSGSGKTHLLSKLCALIPLEHYIPITRATDNSFYNYGKYELRHKLISVEDKDSMSDEASLAFRELQSSGRLSTSTTGQDDHGHSKSYVKLVYGPIASLACTTKGEQYLDDMNRCFLLAVDESQAQTESILDYQKREAAGLVNKGKREELANFMQNCLRLLKSYEVVIPYAPKISLPEEVKDKRRLNSLYLSLVKQITLLHQYQRDQDVQGRLISTLADLEQANSIMFDAIVLKVDELHGPLRSFYEKVKGYIKGIASERMEEYSFRQREIRQALRLSKSGVAQYFRELLELEYMQIVGGSDRRGYLYKLSYWDDSQVVRDHIQGYLSTQISSIVSKSVQKENGHLKG